ncbi:hypothetical protein B9G99_02110 [Kushneria konosiri]|uniref:Uncharacterized protein n=1 Tax=Kushneria konosiri TaxID=698828 RepID=A0A2Z2H4Y2_9GAMM|nr:hypothetical protein B9G99_02110 [Kushneria konosiri]
MESGVIRHTGPDWSGIKWWQAERQVSARSIMDNRANHFLKWAIEVIKNNPTLDIRGPKTERIAAH